MQTVHTFHITVIGKPHSDAYPVSYEAFTDVHATARGIGSTELEAVLALVESWKFMVKQGI